MEESIIKRIYLYTTDYYIYDVYIFVEDHTNEVYEFLNYVEDIVMGKILKEVEVQIDFKVRALRGVNFDSIPETLKLIYP